MVWHLLLALTLLVTAGLPSLALAQQNQAEPAGAITLQPGAESDALIAERIASIFAQIPQFESLHISVNSGVVALSGQAANEAQAQRALKLANRVEGAIAVDDRVVRTLDLQDNLTPLWDSLQNTLRGWVRALPLLLVALSIFLIVAFAGHRLAGHNGLWARLTDNPFLNYTRNPQRRFDFVLGVDAEDDPAHAIQTGLAALQQLDWVLEDPEPSGIIESVGDSNIVIRFLAWIDQRESDYGKARSLSIRAAKNALETQGFTLPEPIYRLRFDQTAATLLTTDLPEMPANAEKPDTGTHTPSPTPKRPPRDDLNVRPDTHISRQVRKERSDAASEDLLDDTRPIE